MNHGRLPLATTEAALTWLELALDYRCNLRCLGCNACHDDGVSMSTEWALAAMRDARGRGTACLWLGGGEPTLRSDLLTLVHGARRLGFDEVVLQTNGMRLAYAAYRDAVLAAGVTHVRVNVKSHRAELHDRLSGGESHALLTKALDGLREGHVRVSADVLLTHSNVAGLADIVSFCASHGVASIWLWLLSASDVPSVDIDREVPSFAELEAPLALAAARAAEAGVELASLHTPPCVLHASLRSLWRPASSLGLLVVGPDGDSFPLESSPFEGGAYVEACDSCAARGPCRGPRADYLRIHGASELTPLQTLPDALGSNP
jgi:MoaA/NifB/PqqE/SkfB family radical SAM enzyme